ncbi:hypothetical protein ACUHMQ_06340 [Chitinimonas sp. PSY-7]|uniref:hypothetical protein n=1 Tax=Chitinimonas sp. PSY-7 TaxID=3459088 RepID=UPI00403FFF5A
MYAEAGNKDKRPRKARRPPVLNLKVEAAPVRDERTPASVISPIFRHPVDTLRALAEPQTLNESPALPAPHINVAAASTDKSDDSHLCLNRAAGDSTGGGVRWSLNDGFGFYVQGKSFKHLQRLVKHHKISGFCQPGDDNPLCLAIPRQNCD